MNWIKARESSSALISKLAHLRTFGHSNTNDDAMITDLLQSGTYTGKAELASAFTLWLSKKVRGQQPDFMRAVDRVLGAQGVGSLTQFNNLLQQRR
jgi:hypothetical protein